MTQHEIIDFYSEIHRIRNDPNMVSNMLRKRKGERKIVYFDYRIESIIPPTRKN